MRRLVFAGLATLALAACNQTAPKPAEPSATTAPQASTQPATQAANPDFPEGLQPPFPYKIRSRKTDDAPNGPVHKLVIEFKQGDKVAVDKQIEDLLVAKGYRRYKTFEQGDGLVGDYGSNGKRVTVTTSPADGKLALDPDSLGTVYFVWQAQ